MTGYESQIINEFVFKHDILVKSVDKIKQYKNPVAIHVRRGDYVKNTNYWVVTEEYIQNAINQFLDDDYTFIVFSDDIDWCKTVFPEGVVYMENNTQFEDLCMMSLCKHNIISNSTFSWWGAFLNKNKSKRVVAPKNWYSDSRSVDYMYPNNWMIL
jgi:hypothetical protein